MRASYRVRLPETLPPGEYDFRIGLMNARTRKPVPIEEISLPHSHGHVRLSTLRLLPPR